MNLRKIVCLMLSASMASQAFGFSGLISTLGLGANAKNSVNAGILAATNNMAKIASSKKTAAIGLGKSSQNFNSKEFAKNLTNSNNKSFFSSMPVICGLSLAGLLVIAGIIIFINKMKKKPDAKDPKKDSPEKTTEKTGSGKETTDESLEDSQKTKKTEHKSPLTDSDCKERDRLVGQGLNDLRGAGSAKEPSENRNSQENEIVEGEVIVERIGAIHIAENNFSANTTQPEISNDKEIEEIKIKIEIAKGELQALITIQDKEKKETNLLRSLFGLNKKLSEKQKNVDEKKEEIKKLEDELRLLEGKTSKNNSGRSKLEVAKSLAKGALSTVENSEVVSALKNGVAVVTKKVSGAISNIIDGAQVLASGENDIIGPDGESIDDLPEIDDTDNENLTQPAGNQQNNQIKVETEEESKSPTDSQEESLGESTDSNGIALTKIFANDDEQEDKNWEIIPAKDFEDPENQKLETQEAAAPKNQIAENQKLAMQTPVTAQEPESKNPFFHIDYNSDEEEELEDEKDNELLMECGVKDPKKFKQEEEEYEKEQEKLKKSFGAAMNGKKDTKNKN